MSKSPSNKVVNIDVNLDDVTKKILLEHVISKA